MKPKPGDTVILTGLPSGFLNDLPSEDQRAVSQVLGKPVVLKDYDEDGRAELEFADCDGVTHFIFVSTDAIRPAD
jgi:hypothetical protein